MPLSNYWHIPFVLHYATGLSPKRVLDVGVGMGCFGFLLRQYCDISAERVDRSKWQTTIHGIEIFQQYENPTWSFAYDHVAIGDICTLVTTMEHYDIIVCADVMEHLEKEDALQLIDELLRRSRTVIITTPAREYPQGEWGGNAAEAHLCHLAVHDFPDAVVVERTGVTNCYVCTRDAEHASMLKRLQREAPWLAPCHLKQMPMKAIRKAMRGLRLPVS